MRSILSDRGQFLWICNEFDRFQRMKILWSIFFKKKPIGVNWNSQFQYLLSISFFTTFHVCLCVLNVDEWPFAHLYYNYIYTVAYVSISRYLCGNYLRAMRKKNVHFALFIQCSLDVIGVSVLRLYLKTFSNWARSEYIHRCTEIDKHTNDIKLERGKKRPKEQIVQI